MRQYAHVVSGFALAGLLLSNLLIGAQAHGRVPVFSDGNAKLPRVALAGYQAPAAEAGLKPEVAALMKASTAEYQKMKTYQHTAEFIIKSDREGASRETAYNLALDRPNRFCFKSDDSVTVAAICDGKLFINLKQDKRYTRAAAPATYKDLNIVDDVTFEPLGTYLIALMLQGDVLADAEVKAGLLKSAAPVTVTEEGKKYDTVVARIGDVNPPTTFYFDAQTHLLHKAVTRDDAQNLRITEIVENVRMNAPVPPAMFQYKLPKDAMLLTRSTHPTDHVTARLIGFRAR